VRELVIAGAGVAGLTAAINLKQAGQAVRVIDRNTASGAQRFPDWDAVENWTSLEDLPPFLARIGVEGHRFRHVGHTHFAVIDPYGVRYDVQTPRPFFYLIKRGATEGGLEHGLQAQAQALGIPIDYDTACPAGQADIWAGGTFGQGSRFVSVGFTFHTDHPDWVCGIVDRSIAPRAYAYLVVVEGEGTLAVVLTEARREANRLLDRAAAVFQQHTALTIREPRKSGGSGGDLAAFWHSAGDFVIGEAAGFQDFLWGFGIRHALTSGYLAAQAILRGEDWQAMADRQIRPLVRTSLVNRWLYDRMPDRGYALLIRRFGTDPDLNALVGRWYRPRRIHRLLWPLAARHFRRQAAAIAGHERYQQRTRAGAGTGGTPPSDLRASREQEGA
jgi:flavin-dependent dehydrogenase